MSGLNPGFTTSNAVDAGASSALKNTDLTEGIYEDASSDMKSKQQGSILSGMSNKLPGGSGGGGGSGGMLDSLAGSTGSLGYDAHHPSTLLPQSSGFAPSKNTTDLSGGLFSSSSGGTQRTANAASHGLQDLKTTAGSYVDSAERKAGEISASAQQTANDVSHAGTSHTNSRGGGILGAVGDKISGVFGSTQSQQQANTFDAGLSSATNSTDLTDGIHEDATKRT